MAIHDDAVKREGERNLKLERKITVGDVITFSSIVLSLIIFAISAERDRNLRRKQEADKVRTAAALTLVKLDRWRELSISVFDQAQPAFVDTKEMLRHNFDLVGARHLLWKNIVAAEVATTQRALDDHLELGYVDLYTYDPSSKDGFTGLLLRLNDYQSQVFGQFLERTQDIMKGLEKKHITKASYDSDALSASLTQAAIDLQDDYTRGINAMLDPLRQALIDVIKRSDDQLLSNPTVQITK